MLASCYPQLQLHQVQPRHKLRYRVLHLRYNHMSQSRAFKPNVTISITGAAHALESCFTVTALHAHVLHLPIASQLHVIGCSAGVTVICHNHLHYNHILRSSPASQSHVTITCLQLCLESLESRLSTCITTTCYSHLPHNQILQSPSALQSVIQSPALQ